MKRLMNYRKPILVMLVLAMTLSLLFAALPAQAAGNNFKLTIVHKINGQKIHQAKDYPVNVKIFKDGTLYYFLNNFKYGQRYSIELPAGTYKFQVFNHITGKIIPGMSVGPAYIKAGAKANLQIKLNSSNKPILLLKR